MTRALRYAAPVAELVREQAAKGVPLRFRVTSGSMAPLILAGDEVVVRSADPGALQPDEIVLMNREGLFVVHRLRAILPDGHLLTHGDRNVEADRPWAPEALVGQVVAVVRDGQACDLLTGAGRARAAWLGRLARLEHGTYSAARAVKRALVGQRSLNMSVAVTHALRAPFAVAARWVAGRRESPSPASGPRPAARRSTGGRGK